jgi:hypothetical protein
MLTNLKTYVRQNPLCRQVGETTLLWLYLEQIDESDFRIVDHDWMGVEMNWDGSGTQPLIVSAPSYGEHVTRKEMMEEIQRVYAERETPQERRERDRHAMCI